MITIRFQAVKVPEAIPVKWVKWENQKTNIEANTRVKTRARLHNNGQDSLAYHKRKGKK